MARRKFNRGDAVIHRGEVKAVQGVARARTEQSWSGGNLYYTIKGTDCTTTQVRSDHLTAAVGAW